ncbi:hypothetical protein AB0C14_07150 [Microbispora hainanensis]|uniref:hypothetical protein n=1 Tax=Microbispora hainanensis TaxID=568844 RepID=UPI0033DF2A87
MDRFVKELEHARGVIGERTEAVRRVFAARGLPAASLNPIGEVERWSDERLPDLRRRHRMAVSLSRTPSWSPGSLVPYDERDGAHSDVAARFAFAVVTGTSGVPLRPAHARPPRRDRGRVRHRVRRGREPGRFQPAAAQRVRAG